MAATYSEIFDALLDNADFEETNSLLKAKAFITAAKRFFIVAPQSASDQGSSQTLSVAQIENLMRDAQAFVVSAARPSGGTRFLGVGSDFRG